MIKHLRMVNLGGQELEFCLIDEGELKTFFDQETMNYGRLDILEYNEEFLRMTNIYALRNNGEIVCVCVRPTYAPILISRLYTNPRYRRLGLATFISDKKLVGGKNVWVCILVDKSIVLGWLLEVLEEVFL